MLFGSNAYAGHLDVGRNGFMEIEMNKTRLLNFALMAALPLTLVPALATAGNAHDLHAGHGTAQVDAGQAALADGVVKKIDKAGGKLTVAHGPLPNGMPAMTMAFKVKDIAWLDKVKEGQEIRFASDTVNGTLTIIRLELPK